MTWNLHEASKTRPMSPETMQRVHQVFEDRQESITYWRDLLVIKLLISLGCRPGEACKAKKEHFNLVERLWYVPAMNEKNHKEKWYPLSEQLVQFLQFYFRICNKMIEQAGGYVVYSRKGGYLDEGKFTSLYNQVVKRAGLDEQIPGKKTHSNKNKLYSIRAGVFTWLREQGYKPEEIMCLSQHSHKSTLERFYIRYDQERTSKKLVVETEALMRPRETLSVEAIPASTKII